MLVAKRDPFHAGAEDVSVPPRNGAVPRFGRAMSALQIAGTLMAIPAAIGSTYSVYRANFSVEATCQSLRATIVAILDKGVDATAQHMLVRRDVEAFQATCGGIDPDATAAFKVLLTGEKKSVPVAAPRLAPVATVAPPRADAKPEVVVRKAEPRPAAVPKQSGAATAPDVSEAKPTQRDAATSDAMWLAAVRQALVAHASHPTTVAEPARTTTASAPPAVAPVVSPGLRETHTLGEIRTPAPVATVQTAAPALPPATSVAIAPAPQVDVDHPVPPAPIPEPSANDASAAPAQARKRSRLGDFVAQIPLVNWALDR
jgi:hypothetical protein